MELFGLLVLLLRVERMGVLVMVMVMVRLEGEDKSLNG